MLDWSESSRLARKRPKGTHSCKACCQDPEKEMQAAASSNIREQMSIKTQHKMGGGE